MYRQLKIYYPFTIDVSFVKVGYNASSTSLIHREPMEVTISFHQLKHAKNISMRCTVVEGNRSRYTIQGYNANGRIITGKGCAGKLGISVVCSISAVKISVRTAPGKPATPLFNPRISCTKPCQTDYCFIYLHLAYNTTIDTNQETLSLLYFLFLLR
ncbi:hypothetical protein BDB01DRAFT_839006 [Pilobolus umbonatus]|nr:hypothetical protein BDB01DRAFT_839006 [Pilobolus umbonatus]